MRRLIATAAATVLLMTAGPALAGGYGHHYGHRHHHGGHGYYVLGALLTGLVIGDLVARAARPPVVRYVQAPQPRLGGCRPTTGTARVNGRLAQFGGTICYDAAGQAYILNDSRYFIGYLQ